MSTTDSEPPPKSQSQAVPRWLLYAVSFWGGFQIMVLEMCGFRVLQTNLGSSVIVTGTLLTVIMVLLSAGYYTGGMLSSKLGSARGLFGLLVIAGVYTEIMTAVFLEPISSLSLSLRTALGAHPYLQAGIPAALLSLVLYGPPVFLTSMISPYWIRLQTVSSGRDGADAGQQSGFFMSLSTVGSIAGTMVASYMLIPFFGVATAAISTNAIFVLLVVAGWFRSRSLSVKQWSVRTLGAIVLGGLVMFGLSLTTPERDPSIVYQAESHYGQLQIVKQVDDHGRTMLEYHPSRILLNSILYPEDPLRDLEGLMFLVPGLLETPKNILVLGSAAGGIMRQIELVYPQAKVTAVDLDPHAHHLAREIFKVNTQQSTLVTSDARIHVSDDTQTYDLIAVDVFAGEFVPTHCITREFFELVRQRLAPGGAMFINTFMYDLHHEVPEQDDPFRPIRHLESTLRAAGFPTLFENGYFNSLFAFPRAVSMTELRKGLLDRYADTASPLGLRAIAGLSAYTTVEVTADRGRYRPFTDVWTPGFMIELKTNEISIFEALENARRRAPSTSTASRDRVAEAVLRQRLSEWRGPDEWPILSDVSQLVSSLNDIPGGREPADLEQAARYFRFSAELKPSTEPARSSWAKLATLYADVYRAGTTYDYEALMPAVQSLKDYLAGGQG
jgi:predicted membrane-bound spermidine synthase